MNAPAPHAHQSSFDQGRLRALEMALASFVRMQQHVPVDMFKAVLTQNEQIWQETTLSMPVTDEYREGLAYGFQSLQSLLPTANPET